jgi:hypothetical protein
MRFCKFCGSEISDTAAVCPSCGKKLIRPSQKDDKKNVNWKKWGGIGAAVLMVVILVVVLSQAGHCQYSGCNNKTVSGSDYCYSHKCSYPSCEKSRFLYSNYCYSHYLLYDDDAETSTTYVSSSELKISNIKLSTSGSYTYAKGTITNNSDETVTYVKIKGSFKDRSGNVVDTDWTYAVGSAGLAPGESCKWEMNVSKDSSITECSVSILDFDY